MVRRCVENKPPEKPEEPPKKFSLLSGSVANFPTMESLEEAIEELQKRISFLKKRHLALTNELEKRQESQRIAEKQQRIEDEKTKLPAEIGSITELREFFRKLIEQNIGPFIHQAETRSMIKILYQTQRYSSKRIVNTLLEQFLARIKALTNLEKKHGKQTKESLLQEFVTDLNSKVDELRQESQKKQLLAQRNADIEAAKILEDIDPDQADPDLIGIPPGAKSAAILTRSNPPPALKFTRLSPPKRYKQDT